MDKQKKLKFNFVDVIFLLVVLAGVAFVAMRLAGSGSNAPSPTPGEGKTGEKYIITFYTTESADYVVKHLQLGSQLTDDSITLDMGTLVGYEAGPAQISSAAADGHLVISDREGYSSVYLMSRIVCTDNGFGVTTADGLRLEIGHSMVLRSHEAKFWVYVYDIQKLEDTPYVDVGIPDANYFHRDGENK